MPNRSKEKGDRAEAQVRDKLLAIRPEVEARRIGLPAQASKVVHGDIELSFGGHDLIVEVKSRDKNRGFGQVLKWLKNRDILALKVEGQLNPVMVLPWELFRELVLDSVELEEVTRDYEPRLVLGSGSDCDAPLDGPEEE